MEVEACSAAPSPTVGVVGGEVEVWTLDVNVVEDDGEGFVKRATEAGKEYNERHCYDCIQKLLGWSYLKVGS